MTFGNIIYIYIYLYWHCRKEERSTCTFVCFFVAMEFECFDFMYSNIRISAFVEAEATIREKLTYKCFPINKAL